MLAPPPPHTEIHKTTKDLKKKKQQNTKKTKAKMQTLCVSWLEAELLFWVCSFLASESTESNVCGEVEGTAPHPPHLHHLHRRPPQKRCYLFIKSEALACRGGQQGMRRTTQPKLFLLLNVFVFRFGKEEVVVSHGAPPPLAALHTAIPISPTRPPPVEGPKSCCNSGTDANRLGRLQR